MINSLFFIVVLYSITIVAQTQGPSAFLQQGIIHFDASYLFGRMWVSYVLLEKYIKVLRLILRSDQYVQLQKFSPLQS